MFIIDFDDTLFDTHAFKQARYQALVPFGVGEELFWQTYREARSTPDGIFTYSNERHAAILAMRGVGEESTLLGALQSTTTVTSLRQFLFADTIMFLTGLRRLKQPMVLLSLGDPGFQEIKVNGTGIADYFDRRYMVDESKAAVIKRVLDETHPKSVWFINDKIDETEAIIQQFPVLRPIMKPSRSVGVASCRASGFACFSTLNEILAYVRP